MRTLDPNQILRQFKLDSHNNLTTDETGHFVVTLLKVKEEEVTDPHSHFCQHFILDNYLFSTPLGRRCKFLVTMAVSRWPAPGGHLGSCPGPIRWSARFVPSFTLRVFVESSA